MPISDMMPHELEEIPLRGRNYPGSPFGSPSLKPHLLPKVHVTSRTMVKLNIISVGCIGPWVFGSSDLQKERRRRELELGCSRRLGTCTDHNLSSLLWFLLPGKIPLPSSSISSISQFGLWEGGRGHVRPHHPGKALSGGVNCPEKTFLLEQDQYPYLEVPQL